MPPETQTTQSRLYDDDVPFDPSIPSRLYGDEIPFDLPSEPESISDDYGMGIVQAFKRGWESVASMPDVLQGDYEELAGHFQRIKELEASDEDAASLREFQESDGFWKSVSWLLTHPKESAQMFAESVPNFLPPIAGALGGAAVGAGAGSLIAPGPGTAVGATIGSRGGFALGSFSGEYLRSVTDYLADKGIDVSDAKQLEQAFSDPELIDGARLFAIKRGIPVAVAETLTFSLAGKFYKPITKALGGGMAAGVVGKASEALLQATGGGTGEVGAQLLSEGEITSMPAIAAEAMLEIPGAVIDPVIKKITDRGGAEEDTDALSRQLRDVPDEELDRMAGTEFSAGDALARQLSQENRDRMQIQQYQRMGEAARIEREAIAAAKAEEAGRSQAFVAGEIAKDTEIERQRREAEYQKELQEGEAAIELAPHEAPATAPKISIKAPTEQVTGKAPGTSLGEALTAAKKKQQAKAEKKAATEGKAIPAAKLTAPVKPAVPRRTKAINVERDSFLTTRAKSPTGQRLSQNAFETEGLDIADLRQPVYGGKPAFSKHPEAMTPDDVAEFLNEQKYPNPYEDGSTGTWDANYALQAVTDEVQGQGGLFTGAGSQTAEAEATYAEELSEFERAKTRRAEQGPPKTFEITVDGIEAQVSEDPSGDVEITVGDNVTTTTRKKGESNADMVRAVLKTQEETEIESEAVEERKAIQAEEAPAEEVTEPEIPGFEDLETVKDEAATSPTNDLKPPTKAQKEAGNYQKSHIKIVGMDISIENPVGSSRRGFKMKDHYGYIKRTEGADGDQVDVFVNPKAAEDFVGKVWVIDQTKEDGVTFDEHKVMLGYGNQMDAVRAYKRNYEKGWKVGPVTEMSMPEFKAWLTRDTTKPIQARPSRHARKFVRTKKGLRYSLPKARKALLDDAREQVPGVDEAWLKKVIGTPSGDTVSTAVENEIVSQIVRLQDQRALPFSQTPLLERDVQSKVTKEVARLNTLFPDAKIRLVNRKDVAAELEDAIQQDLTEKINTAAVAAIYDSYRDEIYVFKTHALTVGIVRRLSLHEMFHKGLTRSLNTHKGYIEVMEDFYENMPIEHKVRLKSIMSTYGLDKTVAEDRQMGAEEVLAHLAETEPKHSWVRKVVAAIRRILTKLRIITPQDTWTDADITKLIAEAHGSLRRNRAKPIEEVSLTEEVQVEGTDEVFDIETNAGVALRQHDKRTNVVEKLRACL